MTKLFGLLFDNTWGKAAAAAAGFFTLVCAFAWDQRNIGGERAARKIDDRTTSAATLGRGAAEQSRSSGVQPGKPFRGRIDPTTRND